MQKVFYVSNVNTDAAFKYAHPRWHEEPVTLYLFDYSGARAILIYECWNGGKPEKPTKREPLKDTLTLSDLYAKIISIGKAESGTIIELHFFTHGNAECGVVVIPRGEGDRREFNRVLAKDGDRGRFFSKAFDANPTVKLWGCGAQPEAKELTLDYWRTTNKKKRNKIQERIEMRIRGMYAFRLSELLETVVWASPIGWSSAMDLPHAAPYYDHWDEDTGPDRCGGEYPPTS